MIVDNRRYIVAIFGCAAMVASNTIIILVVIVATIFLVIIRYEISFSVVIIIFIGRMMVYRMVTVMTIVVGGHCFYCLA